MFDELWPRTTCGVSVRLFGSVDGDGQSASALPLQRRCPRASISVGVYPVATM